MYSQTTRDITINVTPVFLNEQSNPDKSHYVWAYNIRIENNGDKTIQLLSRYWRITDNTGQTQEVRGPGVVGEQPILKPGEAFEYTSGTPLPTPSGIMTGSYFMERDGGEPLEVAIPAFSLDSPHDKAPLH